MLNFKKVSLLFGVVVLLLFLLRMQIDVPSWSFAIAALIYVAWIAIGSARIDSNFFLPVMCNSLTAEKQIALTFDDGPAEETTNRILDILSQNQVSGTFFCIGKKVKTNPGIVGRIDKEGHLIGNHSFSHHFFFDFFSTKKISDELRETNELIRKEINKEIRLFRPPYGVTTPNVASAVRDGKFQAIGWSVRSLDTISRDSDKLLTSSINKIKPGDIILFHDTMEITVKILQDFLDSAREKGFSIVPLDKLLKTNAYD